MQKRYYQLLTLSLEHAFYKDGVAIDLLVEPTPDTKVLMQKNDLLWRMSGRNYVLLFGYEVGLSPALALGDEPLQLQFILKSKSPYFFNFTDLPLQLIGQEDAWFFFENKTPLEPGQQTPVRLTEESTVGSADIVPAAGPRSAYRLQPGDLGIIQFEIGEQTEVMLPFPDPESPDSYAATSFTILFQSRDAYWRYYLINSSQLRFDNLTVTDGRNDLNFLKGDPVLVGGAAEMAIPMWSEMPLPMLEVPFLRPKLKLNGGAGEITLDLPTPDFRRLVIEGSDENTVFYADMYIYL